MLDMCPAVRAASEYVYVVHVISERAKGVEKALCGETVVQKGVFGEPVLFSAPIRFALKTPEFWTTVSPHDAFSAPLRTPIIVGKRAAPERSHLGPSGPKPSS